MKPTLNLPPQLQGTPKATLEVRIDLLNSTSDNEDCNFETAKFIKLQWWGETQDQTAKLPVESGAKVTYNVLTDPGRFKDYLQDCGRLYLETLSHSGKTLGMKISNLPCSITICIQCGTQKSLQVFSF